MEEIIETLRALTGLNEWGKVHPSTEGELAGIAIPTKVVQSGSYTMVTVEARATLRGSLPQVISDLLCFSSGIHHAKNTGVCGSLPIIALSDISLAFEVDPEQTGSSAYFGTGSATFSVTMKLGDVTGGCQC